MARIMLMENSEDWIWWPVTAGAEPRTGASSATARPESGVRVRLSVCSPMLSGSSVSAHRRPFICAFFGKALSS